MYRRRPRPFQFSLGRMLGVMAIAGAYFAVARIGHARTPPDYDLALFAAPPALGGIVGMLTRGPRGAAVGMLWLSTSCLCPVAFLPALLLLPAVLRAEGRFRIRNAESDAS